VAPPARPGHYKLFFASSEAARGWEELCRQAPGNTLTAYEAIGADPCPTPPTPRQHPLKGELALRAYGGKTLPVWQYEVTGSGRIWYLVDHDTRTCWIHVAGTGHPKQTD
jgi:hypothetical protein